MDGLLGAILGAVITPTVAAIIVWARRRWQTRKRERARNERERRKMIRNMRILARSCLNLALRMRALEEKQND